MRAIPQRHSLVGQTVACLHDAIAAGQWREWLPAERTLCELLQISRSTLRRALAQLQRDGAIRAEHGAGNRILAPTPRTRGRLRSTEVALLTPEPLERLRPTQTLWIDDLRAMLSERGCRLHVIHGRQYFRTNPAAALEKLVRQHPHACWLLLLATPACQEWFARRGVPCLVAGSCSDGIDLPFRDLDHRAMCRHAAGVLLGLGHRRLALVAPEVPLAGDLASEAGFLEGVRTSGHADASAIVCRLDAGAAGIVPALKRLMAQKPPPTALLVVHAYHCLAVASGLAALGWRVPDQVSIISRDEDPFLTFLVPTPARYVASPRAYARSLLQPVLELLEGGAVTQRSWRLMPQFVRGASVGAAPAP
ncbi:MAG: substrate-binding domain-containing protein [Verrucomicrobia bacterium]|nr:substrate-binding domain-containing protein [Verrucomicrobiota bacterium]